jgi:hypothetical protein
VEFAESHFAFEGALGKEHQRMAAGRGAQHAPRVGRALVPVEALHEFRAQPPQQQAREGHLVHLALDHEAEARRQGGGHDHAVQVAGVVGHHHALAGGKVLAAADQHRHAGAGEEHPCCNASRPTAQVQCRHEEDAHQGEHDDSQEQQGRV